jgi:hypothetical protein
MESRRLDTLYETMVTQMTRRLFLACIASAAAVAPACAIDPSAPQYGEAPPPAEVRWMAPAVIATGSPSAIVYQPYHATPALRWGFFGRRLVPHTVLIPGQPQLYVPWQPPGQGLSPPALHPQQ